MYDELLSHLPYKNKVVRRIKKNKVVKGLEKLSLRAIASASIEETKQTFETLILTLFFF